MEKSFHITIAPAELDISAEEVARYFGGRKYRMNGKARGHIEDGIQMARKLVEPAAVFGLHAVNSASHEGMLCLEDTLELEIPCFAGNADVKYLASVVATLGIRLEQTCRDLSSRGEIYSATLLDAVGTCQLEALADACRERLTEVANQKRVFPGTSFAPGLNGCDLRGQANLFQLVDTESIGVTLNTDCVMQPVKSISMFMLFTTSPTDEGKYHKCRHCDLEHCQFRVGDGNK